MGHEGYIKEIKKKRLIQEVGNFLRTLDKYGNEFNDSCGYYNSPDIDYLFVSVIHNRILVNKEMKKFGLDEQDLFPIIKNFINIERYNIIWVV